jgi:2-methylcitrate dehydratase PrpD
MADYVVTARQAALPPEVAHHAKRALVDWYAAAVAGTVLPPTTLLERSESEGLDHGRSRLITGRPATMRTAAFINGAASHAAEVDDVFRDAVYHPGSPTIAAALAAGFESATGEELLRAIVIGYELSTRIAKTVFKGHFRFWHLTGTIGAFGAAAAATALLKLPRLEVMHALASVATLTAGLQQAFRSESMSKSLHAAHAADLGVMCAMAAQCGVTGAPDVLEGPVGFGAAMAGNPDWSAVCSSLGREWNIGRVTFKSHFCVGQVFVAIDAAMALQARHGFRVEDIGRLEVSTYSAAIEAAGRYELDGPASARFNLPYVVARALTRGSVRLSAFTKEALEDLDVTGLMKRISFRSDPEFDTVFPDERIARVEVELRDGRSFSHQQNTCKGDPNNPLSDAELTAKFSELVAPVLGNERSERLLNAIWNVNSLASLSHTALFGGN